MSRVYCLWISLIDPSSDIRWLETYDGTDKRWKTLWLGLEQGCARRRLWNTSWTWQCDVDIYHVLYLLS